MTSRRGFIAGLGALATTPTLGWSAVGNPLALSGARLPDGSHALVGIAQNGTLTFQLPLPARAHAGAAHPTQAEAVIIARRPGTFAKVVDCAGGMILQSLHAPEGHHFYGHAAFSKDGHLLFTTENHISSGEGRIGVWDRRLDYTRIDEFGSGGVGPHEILRLPDKRLAVANGGIRTHPATGREKLNIETMRPNLSIFSEGGHLIHRAEPKNSKNSLRHIAATQDGVVICGFQWQGDPYDAPPLIALYSPALGLTEVTMDTATHYTLDGYIGSVSAVGLEGFAASAPRGNQIILFNAEGVQTSTYRAADICGLTSDKSLLLASDGTGSVHVLQGPARRRIAMHKMAFDNHLVNVS